MYGQSSLEVIESGTIRYTGYGFLLVFYSNLTLNASFFQIFDL